MRAPSRSLAVTFALGGLTLLAAPALAQQDPMKTKVSVNFAGTPLSAAVGHLRDQAVGVNLVVAPGVEADRLTVTASAKDQPLDEVLLGIISKHGLVQTRWCGALVIHAPGWTAPAVPDVRATALEEWVTLQLERTPVLAGLERLATRAKLEVVVSARVRAHAANTAATSDLRLFNVTARHALAHLLLGTGITWAWEGGKVVLAVEGDARDVDPRTLDVTGAGKLDLPKLVAELRAPASRDVAMRVLQRAGKDAAGPVAGLLRDPDAPTVLAALKVLAVVGEPSASGAVQAVFRDRSRPTEVRLEAAATLGALKAADAVPLLITHLDDQGSFRISEAARAALTAIGEPALGPLEVAYRRALARPEGEDGVLYRSLLIFGAIGTERCTKTLLAALGKTDSPRAISIRHHAAIGLGLAGDTKTIEPMIDALAREREFVVASYIARSLTWITEADIPPQPDRWRLWWSQNRERFEKRKKPEDDGLFDPIELPLDEQGLPKLDAPGGR